MKSSMKIIIASALVTVVVISAVFVVFMAEKIAIEDMDDDGIPDYMDDILAPPGMTVENFFDVVTNGPVVTNIVSRIHPMGGDTTPVDRFYYAAGEGSIRSPYGIYAKDVSDGSSAWQTGSILKAFNTESPISSNLVGVDFGNSKYSQDFDFWLFFGTEDGMLYTINDGLTNIAVPTGDDVWSAQLDGAITGIAVHNEKYGRILDMHDMFFSNANF